MVHHMTIRRIVIAEIVFTLFAMMLQVVVFSSSPASAACKMNIVVTHPRSQYLVQAELKETCGDRVRAVGDWGGKWRYGTYMLHNYSVACDVPGSCQGHPDGTLRHGGWQDRRTGKYHQTF
jgi:hypothetical protein